MCIEETDGNGYLTLIPTDGNKDILKIAIKDAIKELFKSFLQRYQMGLQEK